MRSASARLPTARTWRPTWANRNSPPWRALVDKPLINLESAVNHPCQSLADWKTLDELGMPRHGKFVLSWAWHPRALPLAVPAATVHMAAMRGMEVVVLRPEGFALPGAIMDKAQRAAAESGGSRARDQRSARGLRGRARGVREGMGAHRATTAMRPRTPRRAAAQATGALSEPWFAGARADCRLMHCLPVRRNVALADELLDGPRSVVLRQAYNRLPAQMAVLHRLLKPTE